MILCDLFTCTALPPIARPKDNQGWNKSSVEWIPYRSFVLQSSSRPNIPNTVVQARVMHASTSTIRPCCDTRSVCAPHPRSQWHSKTQARGEWTPTHNYSQKQDSESHTAFSATWTRGSSTMTMARRECMPLRRRMKKVRCHAPRHYPIQRRFHDKKETIPQSKPTRRQREACQGINIFHIRLVSLSKGKAIRCPSRP